MNRTRSQNPYSHSAKTPYKSAFVPSSHFCYIFKTAQKRTHPRIMPLLTIAFPQILHLSSQLSVRVTIFSCIRHCLVMKTYSSQQQSRMPVELTPLTTCLDSKTRPIQTPGQTHRQWTCCVSCQDTYLYVSHLS